MSVHSKDSRLKTCLVLPMQQYQYKFSTRNTIQWITKKNSTKMPPPWRQQWDSPHSDLTNLLQRSANSTPRQMHLFPDKNWKTLTVEARKGKEVVEIRCRWEK